MTIAAALNAASSGDRRRARSLVAQSIDGGANQLAAAGLIAFVVGAYDRAFELLGRAGAHRLRFERQARIGWAHEAIATARAAIAAAPDKSARWHAELTALYARRRAFEPALHHGQRALELGAEAAPILVELANVHAQRDEVDDVVRCLRAAIASVPESLAYRMEAARLFVSVGLFEAATTELRAALAIDPRCASAHERLGSIAAWSGLVDDAEWHARSALDCEQEHAPAHRLLGVVTRLRGGDPRPHFARAIELYPDESEAHLWLAELALERDDDNAAHRAISRAIGSARGYLFAAQLLRFVVAMVRDADNTELGGQIEHLKRGIRAVCPEFHPTARDEWFAGARLTLDRLGGNRSIHPTHRPGGLLQLVRPGNDPRFDARRAMETIRACSPSDALAAIGDVAALHPWSSLPLAHKGELELWTGDLRAARASLREAIAVSRGTRWAYIGLATIELLEGRPDESLTVNARGVAVMHGTEGPAVCGVRGEALRLLGRIDEAKHDLEQSVRLNPTRLASVINLALVRGDGDATLSWLRARAPGLMHDVAVAENVDVEDLDARAALLRALALFRGNRSSSCQTYFNAAGSLRLVPSASNVHAYDEDDLQRATALLQRAQ